MLSIRKVAGLHRSQPTFDQPTRMADDSQRDISPFIGSLELGDCFGTPAREETEPITLSPISLRYFNLPSEGFTFSNVKESSRIPADWRASTGACSTR